MSATPAKSSVAFSPDDKLGNSKGLLQLLGDESSYADHPKQVDVIETHISWVFLTDRYAYKLKKPVRFEFLDFSTAEKRRRACRDEVRLNRRLAPSVYLAVLPVTRNAAGQLALDGEGTPVDWVVQMRRLPDSCSLTSLIENGGLTAKDSEAIIEHLADFYSGSPSVRISPDEYRATIERHIRANSETLFTARQGELPRIQRVISAQLRYLRVQSELLAKRVTVGRIVDGHGDLRPEHIYFDGRPAVIDCVEFSEELRHVDIADDLSFLAMECEHLGSAELGNRIMAACERICGDVVPVHLSAFYRCYRACVRAKVALLRARQKPNAPRNDNQFIQYLHLADIHAAELGPPMLLVVGGLMGSGKSTLATALAERFGVECISTDRLRRDLFGASPEPARYGEAFYRTDLREKVYDRVFHQADWLLQNKQSAILDGAFLTKSLRRHAYDLAAQHDAVALLVNCRCPRLVALERIRQRRAKGHDTSEARAELYDSQLREYERPTTEEQLVDTSTLRPVDDQVRTVCDALRQRLFP